MGSRAWARDQKKAQKEGRILVFLDESGFYLAPLASYSWSPRGEALHVVGKLRSQHLSVLGAMTYEGRLFLNIHRHSCRGKEVVLFLRPLLFSLPDKLLILWDGGRIHRRKEVSRFLQLDHERRLRFERFPAYAPQVDPQEFVWRALKYDDLVHRTTFPLDQRECHLREAAQRLRRRSDLLRNLVRHAGLDL